MARIKQGLSQAPAYYLLVHYLYLPVFQLTSIQLLKRPSSFLYKARSR